MLPVNKEKVVTLEEIESLRKEIYLMHDSLAHNVVEHAPLMQKVASLFIDKGLDRQWIEKLLAPLVGSGLEEDEEMLLFYILEELDMRLDIKEEDKSFNRVVRVMVGATGIGKTSLIGKLGGRYKYLTKKTSSIAFINYDQLKVGAVEQLAHYGDVMRIPLIDIESLFDQDYEVVFIDTAGSMGKNIESLKSIIQTLKENRNYTIEISLVLSATSKEKDLENILNLFKSLNINDFIFTKLDETTDLSDMINFLIKDKRPLSYLSIGQEIPEDLIVASKEYILNRFMED